MDRKACPTCGSPMRFRLGLGLFRTIQALARFTLPRASDSSDDRAVVGTEDVPRVSRKRTVWGILDVY